ncbi:MAG: MCE family protein [Flavobacteriales bacterium]|nr:MCE family protein [Flavobacteriales bacterium]MCB9194130.1 MCE family protein [Flavobacteriales bacterium]
MPGERSQRFKLGLFVVAGTAVLILTLYIMGTRKDMFARSITISADFREVNGLRTGNNVRYSGINVGTVDAIDIVNDTTVRVRLNIRMDAAGHIRDNALANVGTDGLMGNKLVSIMPGTGEGDPIVDGSVLRSAPGLDTDAMMRTLQRTNDNLLSITEDLRQLSERLNDPNNLVGMLTDTTMGDVWRNAVHQLQAASGNARALTDGVNTLVTDAQQGRGAIGLLLTDQGTEEDVRRILMDLRTAADTLGLAIGRIDRFAQGLNNDRGLAHALTQDTALAGDVRHMMGRLDTTTVLLNEDLRALQRNWLLRKYFKEKEKGRR